MHPLAKKLMFLREFDIGEGQISILGERFLLIPSKIMSEIETVSGLDLEKKYYEIGHSTGKQITETMKKRGVEGGDAWKFIKEFLTMCGWGKVEEVDIDFTNSRAIIKLVSGIKSQKKIHTPNCFILAGILGGVFSNIFPIGVNCVERKCSTADNYCEFVVNQKNGKRI